MSDGAIREHLAALAAALPADGAVSVPVAWIRALTASNGDTEPLLTIQQAAARMGVSKEYLYRRRDLPFRRKLSHRHLAFDANGLEAWLADRAQGRAP